MIFGGLLVHKCENYTGILGVLRIYSTNFRGFGAFFLKMKMSEIGIELS